MKLKDQIIENTNYAMRQRNSARRCNDIEMINYYTGVYEALKWALDSRQDDQPVCEEYIENK